MKQIVVIEIKLIFKYTKGTTREKLHQYSLLFTLVILGQSIC